jgi:hypothetical protein
MTSHQYNLPPLGKRIAYPANREGIVEHFEDRAVRQSIVSSDNYFCRSCCLTSECYPSSSPDSHRTAIMRRARVDAPRRRGGERPSSAIP